MNWLTERDALIAQTLAFVQSVTGRRHDAAPETNPAEPTSVEPTSVEPASVEAASVGPAPIEQASNLSAQLDETAATSPETGPTRELPSATVIAKSDIRKEVQNRIAAFQAHQHRFHRERDAYFNSVLTKVRSNLENGREAPPT